MNNIKEHIKNRRSVRSFDGRELAKTDIEKLTSFAKTIENPYKIPVDFKFMNAKEYGLSCPVTVGTELFIGGKIKYTENFSVAFGYSFEALVLYAQSLGIGTTWLGGTMNRAAFENAMEMDDDQVMPCASPLGYPAKKMSLREIMMRKSIKADERFPFENLFFDSSFDTPLSKERAGKWRDALEMVRLSPSAVNKQPWRVVVSENAVHFYLKRSKGFARTSKLDMQMIDIGIALCHFDLTAKEGNLNIIFEQNDPKIESDAEYIASYRLT
ncbi:MAG: nitroreductase [Clostridia bacterium]|nr:nitroreductase [Clostridia bacterium]